jgi:alanine racemase
MDMLMVDLGATGEAYVGDRVILIGKQGVEEILISQLALKLNSIIYEVLVGFNERIPRVII